MHAAYGRVAAGRVVQVGQAVAEVTGSAHPLPRLPGGPGGPGVVVDRGTDELVEPGTLVEPGRASGAGDSRGQARTRPTLFCCETILITASC